MIATAGIAASVIDRDVLIFSNYQLSVNGITLSGNRIRALNALVRELKRTGIWDKIVAVYPFVGGTANTHSVNLKAVGTYTLTFVGSPTHNATGMLLNGTTQYASSPFIPSNDTGQNDAHLCQATTGATITPFRIGGGQGTGQFRFSNNLSLSIYTISVNSTSAGSISLATDSSGVMVASRINGTAEMWRINATTGTRTVASTARTGRNSFIGSFNATGSPNGFSDGYTQFASLGLGLTTTQMEQFKNAVNQFNLTLGR